MLSLKQNDAAKLIPMLIALVVNKVLIVLLMVFLLQIYGTPRFGVFIGFAVAILILLYFFAVVKYHRWQVRIIATVS